MVITIVCGVGWLSFSLSVVWMFVFTSVFLRSSHSRSSLDPLSADNLLYVGCVSPTILKFKNILSDSSPYHFQKFSVAIPCRRKANTLNLHLGQLGLDPTHPFITSIQKSRKTNKYTHCLILQSGKAMIFIEMLGLFSIQFLDALCHIEVLQNKMIYDFFFPTHWKSFIDKSILIQIYIYI